MLLNKNCLFLKRPANKRFYTRENLSITPVLKEKRFLNFLRKSPSTSNGFTLVEMLVAVAVFSMVSVIISSSLLFMTEASRKSRALNSVMNNLSYAVENMSKSIRTGVYYNCGVSGSLESPNNCSTGEDSIAFESQMGNRGNPSDQWIYKLQGGEILRSTDGGSTFANIVSSRIVIDNLNFYVTGATSGDNTQPRVLIILQGHVNPGKGVETEFNLQTTVTQRVLDF